MATKKLFPYLGLEAVGARVKVRIEFYDGLRGKLRSSCQPEVLNIADRKSCIIFLFESVTRKTSRTSRRNVVLARTNEYHAVGSFLKLQSKGDPQSKHVLRKAK